MALVYKGVGYNALRRGFDEFEHPSDDTLLWPRCEIERCGANVCIGMSKSLCYPHGIEFGAFTQEEFERDREAIDGQFAAGREALCGNGFRVVKPLSALARRINERWHHRQLPSAWKPLSPQTCAAIALSRPPQATRFAMGGGHDRTPGGSDPRQ